MSVILVATKVRFGVLHQVGSTGTIKNKVNQSRYSASSLAGGFVTVLPPKWLIKELFERKRPVFLLVQNSKKEVSTWWL